MSITVWRLIKERYRHDILSGDGARLYGGRWSSPGYPVIYCSQHLSLAILEIMVHVEDRRVLSHYLKLSLQLEGHQIQTVDRKQLPPDWGRPFSGEDVQQVGNIWFESGRFLALKVPSAIVPDEYNFLINSLHPDFSRFAATEPELFALDDRLTGQE